MAEETITKKLAALEVLSEVTISKYGSIAAVVLIFLIGFSSVAFEPAVYVLTIIGCIIFIWNYYRSKKKEEYLNGKYGLGRTITKAVGPKI